MKTCYIHFGMPKTASSSIERFLLKNHVRLQDSGYHVVATGTRDYRENHHRVADALQKAVNGKNTEFFQSLELELKAVDCDNVIISSEKLFRKIIDRRKCKDLVSFFRELEYRIKFFGFIRPQYFYLKSMYTQQLKHVSIRQDFESYVTDAKQAGFLDYHKNFKTLYKSSEFDLEFIPFNAEMLTEGLEKVVLRALNLPASDSHGFLPMGINNQSPDPVTMAAIRKVFQNSAVQWQDIPFEDRRRIGKTIMKYGKELWNGGSYNPISAEQAVEISLYYQQENDRFAQMVWSKEWSDIFSDQTAQMVKIEFDPESDSAALSREVKLVCSLINHLYSHYFFRQGHNGLTVTSRIVDWVAVLSLKAALTYHSSVRRLLRQRQ